MTCSEHPWHHRSISSEFRREMIVYQVLIRNLPTVRSAALGLFCTVFMVQAQAQSGVAPSATAAGTAATTSTPASASAPSAKARTSSAKPSAADVELLAEGCTNCHGPADHPTDSIPPLYGQSVERLMKRMHAFKKAAAQPKTPATVEEGTVMPRLMTGYSDEEIEALARWFANAEADGSRAGERK